MSSIISFIIGKIGFETFRKALIISIATIYYSVVIGFYLFLGDIVLKVYNLISSLFDYITSSSASTNEYLYMFFSLLNCSGIIPAINDNKAILLGALGIYLVRISYSYMLALKTKLFEISSKVIN